MRTPRFRSAARLALSTFSSLLLAAAAWANDGGWDRDQGPWFGSLQSLTVGTAGACGHGRPAIFAAADSGVWRRCGTDGRWHSLGAVIWASSVAVDPRDDRHLVVTGNSLALGTSLLSSHDGGATWKLPKSGLPWAWYNAVKVLPTHPSTTLAAGVGGVFRSVDGGVHWQGVAGIDPSAYVASLAADVRAPRLAFAAGVGGVYRSTDAGGTWTRLAGGLPDAFGDAVAVRVSRQGATVFAAVGGAIWRSLDGGDSWAPVAAAGLPQPHGAIGVTVDAASREPAALYALVIDWTTGLQAVWRSVDGGDSWSPAAPPIAENDAVQAVVADPIVPGAVYTASQIRGMQSSRDGGSTWSTGNDGLNGEVGRVAVAPSAPQVVYAGSYNSGPFRSADGGRSWKRVNGGLYFTGLGVQALAVSPLSADTVFIGTGWGVFASTDGGAQWNWTSEGLPAWNTPVQALAVTPARPGTIYAGTIGSGVYKSVDGGTWTATGFTTANVYAIAIDPVRPDTLYASIYEGAEGPPNTRVGLGIVKSTDSGANWMPVNVGLGNLVVRALAIDAATPTTLYAGTHGDGIYKSVDGGQSWRPAGAGAGRYASGIVIDPRDTSTLYASTYDAGVFRSTDGGRRWTPLNDGLDVPTTSAQAIAIDPANGRRLYLATLMSGVAVRRSGTD